MYYNVQSNNGSNDRTVNMRTTRGNVNYSFWQPEAMTNSKIQNQEKIYSNWEYRKYLQKNADNIMKFNYMDAVNASGNNPKAYNPDTPSPNNPFMFHSLHDQRTPSYGYNNSDLKDSFIRREQLSARMIAPSIPTNF